MPRDFQVLYKNEQYKFGDSEREVAEFAEHVVKVREAQEELARANFSGVLKRVFHAKMHACLLGALTLLPDRPAAIRHGIFADDGKQRFNVLGRFSNGVGQMSHDLLPDVRGLALKLFGVPDPTNAVGAANGRCVDWLMTNSPNPFGRDQAEFVDFMQANLHKFLRLPLFLIKHTDVAKLLFRSTFRITSSLAAERYWSGHAYLLGNESAMKFSVTPEPNLTPATNAPLHHRDYLRMDLLHRLKQAPIRFTLNVQPEISPKTTPIENTLIEWKESDSPSIPVAELEFTRESATIDNEALRFSPGHFIAPHRPLGNLARGRLFTYAASQEGRSALTTDPDEASLFA